MTTLVTGATGNTGRHVVAELLRRGEPVRALSRDPAAAVAAGRLPADGVEVVTGTHTAPKSLDGALAGVDRGAAYVVTPITSTAIADAVTSRRVPFYPGGLTPTELWSSWASVSPDACRRMVAR